MSKSKADPVILDNRVLHAVRDGARRLSAVSNHIATRGGIYSRREIDRSLQRLRKRGVIRYTSLSGWISKRVETCPTCNGKGLVLSE